MKKALALILSMMIAVSMAACSDSSGSGNQTQENQSSSSSKTEESRDYNVLIIEDRACRIPLTWTEEEASGENQYKYTLPTGATCTITHYTKDGVKTVNDLKEFYLDEYQAANGTVEVTEDKPVQINSKMAWQLGMTLTPADGSATKSVYEYILVLDGGYIVYDFTMDGEFDADTQDAIKEIAVKMRQATNEDKAEAEEVLS